MPLDDKSTRREFMIATSTAALGAAVPVTGTDPVSPLANDSGNPASEQIPYSPEELFQRGSQRIFSGVRATQIAMPLGGIGAGCICLNGYGGLQDFSIGNRPTTTALPDGFTSSNAAFAVLHIKGTSPITKLVEGLSRAE